VDVQGVKQEKWGLVDLQHILKTLRIDPQLVLAITEAVTADLHNTLSIATHNICYSVDQTA